MLKWANSKNSEDIANIYKPIVRDTAISFETEMASPHVIAQRIEKIGESNPYLVATVDGKVAGYAYSTDFRARKAYRFTKEATVYVHEDFRKKGIASLLYNKLFEILLVQGVVKIMAVITIPNDKSVLFHEKLGFNLSGIIKASGYKFDQFWDVCFHEKTLESNLVNSPKLKDWKIVKAQFPELIE